MRSSAAIDVASSAACACMTATCSTGCSERKNSTMRGIARDRVRTRSTGLISAFSETSKSGLTSSIVPIIACARLSLPPISRKRSVSSRASTRHFGTRCSTAAVASSRLAHSAATRQRNAIGIETDWLSITLTLNPSTASAPTRAASAVAESRAPMWMEMQPSWSFARRRYTSANSPGDGADVVGRELDAASRVKNWSLVMSTPSRNVSLPKRTLRGTTSIP